MAVGRPTSNYLHETDGVTKVTYSLAFRDQSGRDHKTKSTFSGRP
jgi:hypothetical protein